MSAARCNRIRYLTRRPLSTSNLREDEIGVAGHERNRKGSVVFVVRLRQLGS